jgi:hypothetical protein
VPVLGSSRLTAYLQAAERPDPRARLHPEFAELMRIHRLDHRFVTLTMPNPFPVGAFERRRLRLKWRGDEIDWNAPALATLARRRGASRRDER